jgi:hypothetical protein
LHPPASSGTPMPGIPLRNIAGKVFSIDSRHETPMTAWMFPASTHSLTLELDSETNTGMPSASAAAVNSGIRHLPQFWQRSPMSSRGAVQRSWFRRQTGRSNSRWSRGNAEKTVAHSALFMSMIA